MTKPSTTIVQPPPPQITQQPLQPLPQQTVEESSRQLAESQLEFNPQITAQEVALQQQFAPQLAQLQTDIQGQQAPQLLQQQLQSAQEFTPQFRALLEQNFPQIPVLSRQITQGLQDPSGLNAQQLATQTAGRERSRGQIRQNVREASNLGGTLFSGARQSQEIEALSQFEQSILGQDLTRQQQQREQLNRELITLFQLAGLNVQQPTAPVPGVPSFGQSATPSPDALLAALVGQQQGAVINPAVVGFGQSPLSQVLSPIGQAFSGRS